MSLELRMSNSTRIGLLSIGPLALWGLYFSGFDGNLLNITHNISRQTGTHLGTHSGEPRIIQFLARLSGRMITNDFLVDLTLKYLNCKSNNRNDCAYEHHFTSICIIDWREAGKTPRTIVRICKGSGDQTEY